MYRGFGFRGSVLRRRTFCSPKILTMDMCLVHHEIVPIGCRRPETHQSFFTICLPPSSLIVTLSP